MRFYLALILYRLLLPLLFITAFPGWVVKMIRRGGFGTRLGERASIYTTPLEHEPCEVIIALKLSREWQAVAPGKKFVIATGTSTGHAVATGAGIDDLRVTYAPLDFNWMVSRYLTRFEPAQVVLIEGDIWPGLLRQCQRRGIPATLVNARLSPRSARRYLKARHWVGPLFRLLSGVAVQEKEDVAIWNTLGVPADRILFTGSIKFDPGSGPHPAKRTDFQSMLDAIAPDRPIVLAASTHAGEEAWIAGAIRSARTEVLPVIVPRHAERRAEVKADLGKAGFEVVLRSDFRPPSDPRNACFVIDSTGELRDWTAHADVVIIGKSFLSTGGQNPAEAILARKPLIVGPHMENFEPLVGHLIQAGGCIRAHEPSGVTSAINLALDPVNATQLTNTAALVLGRHEGATARVVRMLEKPDN
jgi:3-deoxy-D-manno-octulosonic-acid transferase